MTIYDHHLIIWSYDMMVMTHCQDHILTENIWCEGDGGRKREKGSLENGRGHSHFQFKKTPWCSDDQMSNIFPIGAIGNFRPGIVSSCRQKNPSFWTGTVLAEGGACPFFGRLARVEKFQDGFWEARLMLWNILRCLNNSTLIFGFCFSDSFQIGFDYWTWQRKKENC